jgi:hypothetical protein
MLAQLWNDWNSVDVIRLMTFVFLINMVRPLAIISGILCGVIFQPGTAAKVAGTCGAILLAVDWYGGELSNNILGAIIYAWACIMAPIAWSVLTSSIIEWRRKRTVE